MTAPTERSEKKIHPGKKFNAGRVQEEKNEDREPVPAGAGRAGR